MYRWWCERGVIGPGGLLRVFPFTCPIKGSDMSIVGFTLTVANDFADFSVNSQPIIMHYSKHYSHGHGANTLNILFKNIAYIRSQFTM